MRSSSDYSKYIKILGIVLAVSLFALLLATIILSAGDVTLGGSNALLSGSAFTVTASCIVSALSLVGIVALLALAKRADRRAVQTTRKPDEPPR